MSENPSIRIVDYKSNYHKAFKELNRAWIETYFKLEVADLKALDNPHTNIIDKGGAIIIVLHDDEPIGVCALIKMNHNLYDFELAKMAVSPKFHRRGIGYLLGKAIIAKAKMLGAKTLYLESNTKLTPAIKLYQKLGFVKVQGPESPYERSNIQMKLILKT